MLPSPWFFSHFLLSLPSTRHNSQPAPPERVRLAQCLLLRSYCCQLTSAAAEMEETDAAFHCRGTLARLLEQSILGQGFYWGSLWVQP